MESTTTQLCCITHPAESTSTQVIFYNSPCWKCLHSVIIITHPITTTTTTTTKHHHEHRGSKIDFSGRNSHGGKESCSLLPASARACTPPYQAQEVSKRGCLLWSEVGCSEGGGGGGETALLDVPREPQLPPARRQPHQAAREYNNRSHAALAECPPNQTRGVNNGRRQVRDSSSSGV